MLTQERLKQLLSYDPETGLFVRLCDRGPSKAGTVVDRRNRDGYCRIYIDGQEYLCHRLAFLYMLGALPVDEVDHINHVRNDNRWANLRKATRQQNCKNKLPHSNSRSGIPGVSWRKKDRRWFATIWSDGAAIHLGSFVEMEAAVAARIAAEIRFGFHPNHGRAE